MQVCQAKAIGAFNRHEGGGSDVNALILNGFPTWYHPVFKSNRFRRVTQDRFFISVEAKDPIFDEGRTEEFLRTLGGRSIERLED